MIEQKIIPNHPCANHNGGCEKFCFAVPSLTETSGLAAGCSCSNGEHLSEDNKSCSAGIGTGPDPDEDHIHHLSK